MSNYTLDELKEIMGTSPGKPLGEAPAPDSVDPDTKLRAAVLRASESDPAKETKKREIAERLKVPSDIVPDNGEATAIQRENRPDLMRLQTPATARYLETPGNAELVGKDIGSSRKFEESFNKLEIDYENYDVLQSMEQHHRNTQMDLIKDNLGKDSNRIFDLGLQWQVGGRLIMREAGIGILDFFTQGRYSKHLKETGQYDPELERELYESLLTDQAKKDREHIMNQEGFGNTVAALADRPWAAANMLVEFFKPMKDVGGGLNKILQQRAIRKLQQAGPINKGLTAKQKVGLGVGTGAVAEGAHVLGLQTKEVLEQQQGKLLELEQQGYIGASALTSTALGWLVGGFAAKKGITDIETFWATNQLDEVLRASNQSFKPNGVQLTQALALNAFEEWAQESQEQVFQNLASGKPWDEGVPEAGAVGLVLGGAHGTFAASAEAYQGRIQNKAAQERINKAKEFKAQQDRVILGDLSKLAADHPQRKRSFKQFHDFIKFVSEDGGKPEEVFVDAQILQDTFNQQGVTDQEIQEKMPDLAQQLDVALKTNGEVKISMADYFTHLAGTPSEDRLLDNLRVTEDGMTFKESQDALKDQAKDFEEQIAEFNEEYKPLLTRAEFEQLPPEYIPAEKSEEQKEFEKNVIRSVRGEKKDIELGQPDQERKRPVSRVKSYEDYLAENNTTASFEAEGESVGEILLERMNRMGRFTPEENAVNMIPLREFYKQQARLSGRTPLQMLEKFDIAFQRNGVSELGQPTYKGHLVDSGGIQGHSLGDTYPIMIVGRADDTYQSFNAITGEYGPRVKSAQEALDNPPVSVARVSDFKPGNVQNILQKDGWAIITAYKGNDKEVNEKANDSLEKDLQELQLRYTLTEGTYQGEAAEPGFLIFNITEEKAKELGNKYKQDSVLTRTGLLYHDGRVERATKVTEGKAKGDHTYLPETGARFNISFAKEGAIRTRGVHFSKSQREVLDGRFAGTGIPGEERGRLAESTDERIKRRVDFYVDMGSGVTPEAGLGAIRHTVPLDNIYDASVDADKLFKPNINKDKEGNDFESAVLDAGYDGYFTKQGTQGRVVILGDASNEIHVPPQDTFNQSGLVESVKVDGRIRPTRDADGNFIHPTEEGIKNFWRWFGDSKTVDDQGRPMVFFHGTNTDFDSFSKELLGDTTGAKSAKKGFFFTNDTETARTYARYAASNNREIRKLTEAAIAAEKAGDFDAYEDLLILAEERERDFVDQLGDNILPVYLKAEDPSIFQAAGESYYGLPTPINVVVQEAIDNDRDSVIIENLDDAPGRADLVSDHVVVFNANQIKSAIGNIGTFRPNEDSILRQENRAGFTPRTLTVNMLDASDKSSMTHELGHFYLHAMGVMATETESSPQLKKDFEATMKWFGLDVTAEQWNAMSVKEQEPYHEQWAQAWELYMLEGKSPTVEMQPVFARFRQWMMGVYQSIKHFHEVNNKAHLLNDDMRRVFDRRLASDEAIREAEKAMSYAPLFTSAEEAGMTDDEYVDYLELHGRATEEAMNDLGSRTVRDIKWASGARLKALKDLQKKADSERERIRNDVSEQVHNYKVNKTRKVLRTGKWVNDAGEEVSVDIKLNAKQVKETSGIKFNRLKGMTSAKDGMDIDEAATFFGYPSGESMVHDLVTAPNAEAEIDALVDQRMMEEHAEIATTKAIQVAAEAAIHNELRARVMATDLHALNKKAGTPAAMNRAAKQAAEQSIDARKVRDIHPHQYERAEAKANAEALKNVTKKPKEAIKATQAALLNNRLAKAAQSARNEVEAVLKYVQKFKKKATRKAIGDNQMDQIDKLLDAFNFRKGETLKSIDQVKALSTWLKEQEQRGFEPIIDAELMEHVRRKHYKDMTMGELRELVSTIKQIEHIGRLNRKLLTAESDKRFGDAVKDAWDSIEANAKKDVKEHGTPNDMFSRFGAWVRSGLAAHRKFASLLRQMDGGKDGGIMWELFLRPMNEAGDRETRMKAEASEALGVLFDRMPKEDFGSNIYARKKLVPGTDISMTHEERIMFAMNWGNLGNRQRLLDGGLANKKVITMEEAEAILDTLTEEEWNFVQSVLDYIGSFREDIAKLERELTGVEPQWVEAEPILTKYGVFRGGYFPAKYDSKLSTRSQSFEALANLRMAMKGAFGAAATRSGYVQERAKEVHGRPILLSYNTIASHVGEVSHRLAWQPWLVDANRLLNALDEPIRAHYGQEVFEALQLTKQAIAEGDVPARS